MIWRKRKVLRDREAGMVFDWRRGHGSTYRFVVGAVVSASFWGAILAYVQINESEPVEALDDQINLTLVNLGTEENRWLAELIDRETLFQQRWEVRDHSVVDQEVEKALEVSSPWEYSPTLREISVTDPAPRLVNLPGMGPRKIPRPDPVLSVAQELPPINWWIEVVVIDGPAELQPFSFACDWPADVVSMSEGEIWPVVVSVDWLGRVVAAEAWWEKGEDVRTSAILEKVRSQHYPSLPAEAPLRNWRLEAQIVNRPPSE